jgi:hypothetical protein
VTVKEEFQQKHRCPKCGGAFVDAQLWMPSLVGLIRCGDLQPELELSCGCGHRWIVEKSEA